MSGRREFIKRAALLTAGMSVIGGGAFASDAASSAVGSKGAAPVDKVFPRALRKGDKVAIVSPASPTSVGSVGGCISYFKSMGCEVVLGDLIKNSKVKNGYLAGTDEARAEEFMTFIADPTVAAIICARGGYGVMRILDRLDFGVIAANPKIIMGFSDITALLNAIYARTGIVTFHGPVASSGFGKMMRENLTQLIFGEPGETTWSLPTSQFQTLVKGVGSGRLVGGNLTMLSSLLGTPYEADTRDAIIFIEEVSEPSYKIDRMLTQLRLAGKFDAARGIIFGKFDDMAKRKPFFPNYGLSLIEALEQIIIPLKLPTLIGLPISHHEERLTFPIGIEAELDTEKNILTFTEKTVT
ncbi:MAG: S66 peptidase family protein [Chloroflexota bacterium]